MKYLFAVSICMGFTMIFITGVQAQDKKFIPISKYPKDTTVTLQTDTSEQKDLYDVVAALLIKNYMPDKSVTVVTTKPAISVVPAIGYTLQSRLAIVLSGNMAFRTAPASRVSTVIASADYTQNKQFTVPILSSIWTRDNNYNFIGTYRFYKYPQSTFGLGTNTSIADEDPMDYSYLNLSQIVMRHITNSFYLGGGYVFDDHWNISDVPNADGKPTDFELYNGASHTISSGITLNANYDTRDNSINPLKGFYAGLQLRNNFKFLGSTDNWQSLLIDVRKYFRLPANSENVLAFWLYDWLTISGKPPYLDLPSNAWDPNTGTGRGYIQGRFRGAQMVYGEAEYRYRITANGLLGGVVYINAESFSAQPGTPLQSIQPGFGPGLRVKLNKISRTNIAIDYGFGNQGSRGLFIDVGEVF